MKGRCRGGKKNQCEWSVYVAGLFLSSASSFPYTRFPRKSVERWTCHEKRNLKTAPVKYSSYKNKLKEKPKTVIRLSVSKSVFIG